MTLLGKTIGNFRITELIGEGGMGEVYIGYDDRLHRKVALKAIRGEKRFDEQAKTRLLREAEILSRLEHPNICRLYDFVETEDADVLVLELIKGRQLNRMPILALSRPERLKIAIQIGEVLSAAHARSVVHRDLKPENIMIDSRGEVKVLDFGLAYSTLNRETVTKFWTSMNIKDSDSETTVIRKSPGGGFMTEQGIIMGTPMYMSPEQAHCEPATAASDMYSFGLVLQLLFTGKPPYPTDLPVEQVFLRAGTGETLPPEGVDENLRKLIERLKSVDPARRPTAVDTVERLKWIVETPKRRAKKMAIGAIIATLTAGIIISSFSLYRAKRSERLERIARSRQEKMSDFLVDMWISPSPMEQGRDVKVIDVLAYGKEKVDEQFEDDPLLKATLINHLATTYRRLGEYEKAEELITECLFYCRSRLGPDHFRTITAMIDLGILMGYDERFQDAEELFREALALGKDKFEPDSETLIYAREELAGILMSKAEYKEAETLLQEVLSTIRGNDELMYKFGPKVLLDLGSILMQEEDYAAAEKIFLELIEDYERKGDTENPNYIAARGSIARAFMEQKKHEEGLRYMRESLELSIRINGERTRNTIVFMINLGQVLSELGRYEEALEYTGRGFDIVKELFGERAPATIFVSTNYANLLRELGRVEEAEPLLREAVSLNTEVVGAEHPNTMLSQYGLALLLFESGRDAEAETLIQDVLETSTRVLGVDKQVTLECKDLLGRVLNRKGEHAQAAIIHREVLETRKGSLGEDDTSMANTLLYLAESLYRQGKNEEACQLIEESLRTHLDVYGEDHPGTGKIASHLVEIFTASGKAAEADSILSSWGLTI